MTVLHELTSLEVTTDNRSKRIHDTCHQQTGGRDTSSSICSALRKENRVSFPSPTGILVHAYAVATPGSTQHSPSPPTPLVLGRVWEKRVDSFECTCSPSRG